MAVNCLAYDLGQLIQREKGNCIVDYGPPLLALRPKFRMHCCSSCWPKLSKAPFSRYARAHSLDIAGAHVKILV